jgi:hypothetical protein
VIIAWVLSLLVLLSSLVAQIERLTALEIVGANSYIESQKQFITAERSLLECERHLSNITALEDTSCHIQSAGKNLWLISSKEKPVLEILVYLDVKTNVVTRLNWRQNFE